jgi:hypothetical protein
MPHCVILEDASRGFLQALRRALTPASLGLAQDDRMIFASAITICFCHY